MAVDVGRSGTPSVSQASRNDRLWVASHRVAPERRNGVRDGAWQGKLASSLGAVLVAACSVAGPTVTLPSATGSLAPTLLPSSPPGTPGVATKSTPLYPTMVNPTSSAQSGSQPPSVSPEGHDRPRSDAFWRSITHVGHYGLTYESLSEITAATHLIVRGHVTGAREGYFYPYGGGSDQIPITVGLFTIDEILKGQPESRQPGVIEVAELADTETTSANLPSDGVLLFLMNEAQQRAEAGNPLTDPEQERYTYLRPNGYQCVLRNWNGRVIVTDRNEIEGFPEALHGTDFAAVIDEVRELVSEPDSQALPRPGAPKQAAD
jgi:hypothetical protein